MANDRGVFTDLQAQNDIVAPLVIAMVALSSAGDANATDWITRNAAAAAHARAPDGLCARFFDGPPPPAGGRVSVHETNDPVPFNAEQGGTEIDVTQTLVLP